MIYFLQVFYYAHSQDSVLDEGLYLLKGFLFTSGKYKPYQDFGPWTNKMPLSFLIPGYVQKIFGSGLRTGRYYAIALSLFFILGVYLVARRLGGRWGSALAVIMIALNPATLKIYSMVLSEGLIATMLIWILYLILGRGRPRWQVILGSILAGLVPLTRINISPFFPLVLLYNFWEHGKTTGFISVISGLGSLIIGLIAFSPGIIPWWLIWIPEKLTPFLNEYRWNYDGGRRLGSDPVSMVSAINAFFEAIRFHWPYFVSVALSWIHWPKKWRDQENRKLVWILSLMFFVLSFLHFWYGFVIGRNAYGFSVHMGFFSFIGTLILIASFPDWSWVVLPIKRKLLGGLFLSLLTAVLISGSGSKTIPGRFIGWVLRQRMVVFDGGKFSLLSKPIWKYLFKCCGWRYGEIVWISSTLMILVLFGLLIVFLINNEQVHKWQTAFWKKIVDIEADVFSITLASVLLFSIILTPTEILGGGRHNWDCRYGVIKSYEDAADEILLEINKGDIVYWEGRATQSLLLGLGEITIHPQVLNTKFSYRVGGEPQALARHGFWSQELRQRWVKSSDVLLLEEAVIENWIRDYIYQSETSNFMEVRSTDNVGCREDANIWIFRSNQ